jgi:homospermidine synthase
VLVSFDYHFTNIVDKKTGSSAVVDHGANPGLISHFVKQAIVDIAEKAVKENKYDPDTAKQIAQLLAATKNEGQRKISFARLAMILGIKVIHCSERDTQIANRPREIGEFVNTWSVEGKQ